MKKTNRGRRTLSWTARSNHSQIVNDKYIQKFIKGCKFPARPRLQSDGTNEIIADISTVNLNEKHILTVDGNYTIVNVQKEFPSSQIAFFQFGAVIFSTTDLENLSKIPFIFPEDMNKLHNLQRIKFALPIKNITSSNQNSLNESIRKSIYDFFIREKTYEISLMETLSWLIFEGYSENPTDSYVLSSNPNLNSSTGSVLLKKSEMKLNYTFDYGGEVIYLTDIFRLHEAMIKSLGQLAFLGMFPG